MANVMLPIIRFLGVWKHFITHFISFFSHSTERTQKYVVYMNVWILTMAHILRLLMLSLGAPRPHGFVSVILSCVIRNVASCFSPTLSSMDSRAPRWQVCVHGERSKTNGKPTGRTCPNTQTKQKPKFDLLFCKEWEIQCECVGKLMNHCCVAKRQQRQRDNQGSERPTRASPLQIRFLSQQKIKRYAEAKSYLPARVFNDLHQWDPCWHLWKDLKLPNGGGREKERWQKEQVSGSFMHLKSVLSVVRAAFRRILLRWPASSTTDSPWINKLNPASAELVELAN